jgi:hypothetical protein
MLQFEEHGIFLSETSKRWLRGNPDRANQNVKKSIKGKGHPLYRH